MLDFTLENNGGGGGGSLPDQTGHSGEFLTTNGTAASWAAVQGGSFSEAALSYPTGTQALNDVELYNYIKTMYDVAPSTSVSDTNLTITGNDTITDDGIITYHAGVSSRIYGKVTSANPSSFIIKGSIEMNENKTAYLVKLTDNTAAYDNSNDVVLQAGSWENHPFCFVLYYRTGNNQRTYTFSPSNLWAIDQKRYFEIRYDGTNLKLLTGTAANSLTEQISASDFVPTTYQYIYFASTVTQEFDEAVNITLNLNDYSYYLNGSLDFTPYYYVYQYKTLATGAKVVDTSYENVIASMKTRFGSALYFVIDTTDQTITLPQGDIFGFITQNSDLASRVAYIEQYLGINQ